VPKEQGVMYEEICNKYWDVDPISWKGFSKEYKMDIDYLLDFHRYCKTFYPNFIKFYSTNIKNNNYLKDYFSSFNNISMYSKCCILNDTIVIEADGSIVLCPDFPDICVGNIFNTSVMNFISNKTRKEFISLFNENRGLPICNRCCQFT
jgi:radical SAM protein with 4Fe4S-binding SPASM domain